MQIDTRWKSRFPLKSGKWVFVPTQSSKVFGKQVSRLIKSKWAIPEYFYHLKPGGHVEAIRLHANHQFFSRLDIDNFFGSISRSRVARSLKEFLGYKKSWEIALNSAVKIPNSYPIQFMLPFGFVQSPILASVCLDRSNLGKTLFRVSKISGISLSVYMDDILISSNDDALLRRLTIEVKDQMLRSHWLSNSSKEVISAPSVTAFNIDLKRAHYEITNARLQKLLHEYMGTINVNKKSGIRKYVRSVNPMQLNQFP